MADTRPGNRHEIWCLTKCELSDAFIQPPVTPCRHTTFTSNSDEFSGAPLLSFSAFSGTSNGVHDTVVQHQQRWFEILANLVEPAAATVPGGGTSSKMSTSALTEVLSSAIESVQNDEQVRFETFSVPRMSPAEGHE